MMQIQAPLELAAGGSGVNVTMLTLTNLQLAGLALILLCAIAAAAWSVRRTNQLAGKIGELASQATRDRITANMADGRIGALVNLFTRSAVVPRAKPDHGKIICVNSLELDACLRALSLQAKLRNGDVLGAGAPDPELADWAEQPPPAPVPPFERL